MVFALLADGIMMICLARLFPGLYLGVDYVEQEAAGVSGGFLGGLFNRGPRTILMQKVLREGPNAMVQ